MQGDARPIVGLVRDLGDGTYSAAAAVSVAASYEVVLVLLTPGSRDCAEIVPRLCAEVVLVLLTPG